MHFKLLYSAGRVSERWLKMYTVAVKNKTLGIRSAVLEKLYTSSTRNLYIYVYAERKVLTIAHPLDFSWKEVRNYWIVHHGYIKYINFAYYFCIMYLVLIYNINGSWVLYIFPFNFGTRRYVMYRYSIYIKYQTIKLFQTIFWKQTDRCTSFLPTIAKIIRYLSL